MPWQETNKVEWTNHSMSDGEPNIVRCPTCGVIKLKVYCPILNENVDYCSQLKNPSMCDPQYCPNKITASD